MKLFNMKHVIRLYWDKSDPNVSISFHWLSIIGGILIMIIGSSCDQRNQAFYIFFSMSLDQSNQHWLLFSSFLISLLFGFNTCSVSEPEMVDTISFAFPKHNDQKS